MLIYHITQKSDWLAAGGKGFYTAPSLDGDGFIHCSLRNQVSDTAVRYYAGVHGLVLLEIDPEQLTSRWVVEPSVGEELFPHVYGRINLEAVRRVADFEPQPDGKFLFPTEFE